MPAISILPGELFDSALVQTHRVVDRPNADMIFKNLMTLRNKNAHIIYNHFIQYRWVIGVAGKCPQHTLLENVEGTEYLMPKLGCYVFSAERVNIMLNTVDFDDIPLKYSLVPKMTKRMTKVPIMEMIEEKEMKIVYDETLGKRIGKFVKTGKTVEKQKKEDIDVYDCDGAFLYSQNVDMFEDKEVEELEKDDSGDVVYDKEYDAVTGKPIQIPIYDKRFLDADYQNIGCAELSKYVAYFLPCLKLSDICIKAI